MKFEELYKKMFTDRDIQWDNPLTVVQVGGRWADIQDVVYDRETNTLAFKILEVGE